MKTTNAAEITAIWKRQRLSFDEYRAALDLFEAVYEQERADAERKQNHFSAVSAATAWAVLAVFTAGKIQGKREERQRRKGRLL